MAGRLDMLGELWGFMRARKRFWLLPLVLLFACIGVLLIFAQGAAAPFIYTLF